MRWAPVWLMPLALLVACGEPESAAASRMSQGSSGSTVPVEITSDPTGARVLIGGVHQGNTPVTINVRPNTSVTYRVEATEPYADYDLYKPFTGTLNTSEPTAIVVWLDRTTAVEQASIRLQREAARQAAAEAECRRRLSGTPLIIENWRWSYTSTGRYVTAEGRITNVSGRSIDSIRALVEYFTADGTFITSDYSYVEIRPLLPGQATPFSVMTNANPAMSTASIRFLDRGSSVLGAMRRTDLGNCGAS